MENENLTNHIACPKCGTKIPVSGSRGNRLGRKSRDITFTNVCKALQIASRGKPDYTDSAKVLEKLTGEKVSPAFIWMRVKREADKRGISRQSLLEEILGLS